MIDSPGFEFPSDYKVKNYHEIDFEKNRNISYLPEKIAGIFLKLAVITADHCGIKTIAKVNFEDLTGLLKVQLDHNRLTHIQSDTFDDLVSLNFLSLSE